MKKCDQTAFCWSTLITLFFCLGGFVYGQSDGSEPTGFVLPVDSTGYRLTEFPFNSEGHDLGAVPMGNQLLFSSDQKRGGLFGKKDKSGAFYYHRWIVPHGAAGEWGKPEPFIKKRNRACHEGLMTPAGARGYWYMRSEAGLWPPAGLRTEFAGYLVHGKWENRKKEPKWEEKILIPKAAVGYPSLSPDGEKMCFASNVEGGYGGWDLWFCQKTDSGWAAPENAGPAINSEGDEAFPFWFEENTLYFSSNGQPGLGGWDLFEAHKHETWDTIRNLGPPFNTQWTEVGLSLEKTGKAGFFSSMRPGGKGGMDIYGFVKIQTVLNGSLSEAGTTNPVSEAIVTLLDGEGQEVDRAFSSFGGKFSFTLDRGKKYQLNIQKKGLGGISRTILPPETLEDSILNFDLKMAPAGGVLAVQFRNAESLELEPISGARVHLGKKGVFASDSLGRCWVPLSETGMIDLKFRAKGFLTDSISFNLPEISTKPDTIYTEIALWDKKWEKRMEVLVLHKQNLRPLPNTSIILKPGNSLFGQQEFTDENGWAYLEQKRESAYDFSISRPGYDTLFMSVLPEDFAGRQALALSPCGPDTKTELWQVDFEGDSWQLDEDGKAALDLVALFLMENPGVKIELGAHTDSRGNAAQNRRLSSQRANVARSYLVEAGISADRLSAVGYGEMMPLNKCRDGVPCPESAHLRNRRMEMRIMREGEPMYGSPVASTLPVAKPEPQPENKPEPEIKPVNKPKPKPEEKPLARKVNVYEEVWANDPAESQMEPGIVYRIQIGVFGGKPKPDFLKKLGPYRVDLDVTPVRNLHRYTIGKYYRYAEAMRNLSEIQQMGFADAFIIAFDNGKRVPAEKAAGR